VNNRKSLSMITMKRNWYERIGTEWRNIDFEERFWYKICGLIKGQYYRLTKSEKKIQYNCRCIKNSMDSEKCVELLIIDQLMMPYYDREENPAWKLFHDDCDDFMCMRRYEKYIAWKYWVDKTLWHSRCKAVLQHMNEFSV